LSLSNFLLKRLSDCMALGRREVLADLVLRQFPRQPSPVASLSRSGAALCCRRAFAAA
jgi:hypothetical protein